MWIKLLSKAKYLKLLALKEENATLQKLLSSEITKRTKAENEVSRLEVISENDRKDSIRWRDERNKFAKELEKERKLNRHLESQLEKHKSLFICE